MAAILEATALSMIAGIVISQAHFYVLRKRERISKHAARLNQAADLLDRHVEAFGLFVDDPASPAELKDILLNFGDAISSEETAHEFAEIVLAHQPRPSPEQGRFVRDALDGLRSHRPDLADQFLKSVMSGLFYMFLRWPETSNVFEEAATLVATEPNRGIEFAAKSAETQSAKPLARPRPQLVLACA